MERSAKATDAAKAIIDLVHSADGVRVKTRGGMKGGWDSGGGSDKKRRRRKPTKTRKARNAPPRLTRQELADADASGEIIVNPPEPPPPTQFRNPMLARGDIIIGGLNGAAVRLPMGTNGQVLGVVNGQLAWVSVVDMGADPNYYTYFDGSTDVELTYFDGSTDYELWL